MPKLLKPSQALLRVKSILPSTVNEEASPYICDNVDKLYHRGKIDAETRHIICEHINTLLDTRFSLGSWLIADGRITSEQLLEDIHKNNGTMLQYTRQNWLNDMHFYFKSKGM